MDLRIFHGRTVAGHHRDRIGRRTASRDSSLRKQEEPLRGPKEKGKGKGKRKGQRQGEKASNATCAEELDTPRGCALRLKEKTPMRTNTGPKKTTRHSNWDTLAASLVC